jgi:hypothetical protein
MGKARNRSSKTPHASEIIPPIELPKKGSLGDKIALFFKAPYVAILTLIISFSGGIPGCMALVDYLHRGPQFVFSCSAFSHGQIHGKNNVEYNSLILSGTMINKGKYPLFVDGFKLKIVTNDGKTTWGQLVKMPSRLTEHGVDSSVEEYSNSPDLAMTKSIESNVAYNGNILFYISIPNTIFSSLQPKMTLICVDLEGTEYPSAVIDYSERQFNNNQYFRGGLQYYLKGINEDTSKY